MIWSVPALPQGRPTMEKIVSCQKGCVWLLAYYPGQPGYYGEFNQCSSDVYLLLRRKGCPTEVLPLVPHRGKGGRHDLQVKIPGWPKNSYFMRVLGWYFLNARHMAWSEYTAKVEHGRGMVYKWRVNHTKGRPEHCILDDLKLVPFEDDIDHYGEHAQEFYGTVWKKPAAKRPAACLCE